MICIFFCSCYIRWVLMIDASVAQLVEHHVANVIVAGSTPVTRSNFDNAVWQVSSVGRAGDWKSPCPQFDSGTGHHFCIYASQTDWLFCFLPHNLPSKTAMRSVRKAMIHTKTVQNCSVAQIFRKVPVSSSIFDTVRNLLQINACLLQYSRQFFPSRNPYQPRFEPQSSRGICLSQRRKIIS